MPTTYYTPGRGLVSQDEGGSASRTFYHGDQVGSTRLLTGPAGSGPGGEGVSAAYASYTAFGEHVGAGVIGEAPAGLGVRYGFCGQWGYQTAGLNPQGFMMPGGSVAGSYDFGYVHVGARYYDPAAGRFLQRDPIGLFGGFNVYAYCANNPVSHVDPTGMQSVARPGELVRRQALAGYGIAGLCGAGGSALISSGAATLNPNQIMSGIALVRAGQVGFWIASFLYAYASVVDATFEIMESL
ncbi:MAG: RHS repeat-associated core domain-containing protein [Phycisphaerales bacterium]|nr:RHS repeat-associated core domain-containing protein [Phycisphaerales bacterium]